MYIQNNALNAPSICALSIKTDKIFTKFSIFKSRIILATVTVHHAAVGLSRENVSQQFLMNVDLPQLAAGPGIHEVDRRFPAASHERTKRYGSRRIILLRTEIERKRCTGAFYGSGFTE